jgi:hypothetical protein
MCCMSLIFPKNSNQNARVRNNFSIEINKGMRKISIFTVCR